jgi:predicted transposase YdaD
MTSKRFDVSLKDLIEDDVLSWAQRFSPHPVRAAALMDADVSTVTAAADKVLRVESARGTALLNIEADARHAADAPDRMLLYSTVLRHRHDLPVHCVLLLLRREANAGNLTGVLEVHLPGVQEPYLTFRYQVVRLWAEPLEPLLTGGLGTLPLAALTDEAEANLPGVVRRIDERLRQEAPPVLADKMRVAIYVLLGLRYEEALIEQLFKEITTMEESTTYRGILARGETRGFDRGRLQGERQVLLRQGRSKFGEPDDATLAALEAITNPERLEALGERLLHVDSWQDLLADA